MRAFTSTLALSALVAAANAASSTSSGPTSTISIGFPGVDPTDLGLSVVTAAPSSTVYAVGCALNSDGTPKNTECHWTSGLNPYLTLASSSLGFNITAGEDVMTFKCKTSSTTDAACETISKSGSHTHKETHSESLEYGAATITAGLELLQASASSGSSAGASASGASTTTGGSTTVTGAAASSGTTSASSSSSTGAAARETGLGLLAVVGLVGAGMAI